MNQDFSNNEFPVPFCRSLNLQCLFSRDTMLKVWDTNTGEEIRSMGGHTGGITSVVLVKKDTQGILADMCCM